ncbi:Formylglycine-generating enzyme, required for sulfatase activity, contains SUMF1/FGE domain, partial [Desulfatibacillum alkenivorans DSM 16219]
EESGSEEEKEAGGEDLEIVELDEDEDLEVEDVEEGEGEEGEGEEGEEVGEPDADVRFEDLDDDVEIIDTDELEYEDIEEEPESIEEDDDVEIVELDDDEELVDVEDWEGDEAALDDDVEIVDAPEDGLEEIDELEDDADIVEDGIDADVEELEGDLEDVEGMDDDEELEEVEEALSDEEGEPTEGDGFGDGDVEEEDEEEFEEVGFLDDDEELEILDDDMDLEEVEEAPEQGAMEPSMGALGADDSLEVEEDKARVLAEQFDGFLGSMEKAYNQYLLIPEGRYVVGCKSPGKGDRPRQKIDMPPFYMGKFPVTNALFEIFVEKTGYTTTAEEKGYSMVYKSRYEKITDPRTGKTHVRYNQSRSCEKVEGANWYQPLGPGSTLYRKRNHPVVHVSRRDAIAFAAWTGKKLPGEDEWEAAARTIKGLIYPWGSEWEEGRANTEEAKIGDTCPVEHLPNTNALNISGMAGNILEWTADLADSDKPEVFVVKGSAWISSPPAPLYARTFCKGSETSNILGFRCVAI